MSSSLWLVRLLPLTHTPFEAFPLAFPLVTTPLSLSGKTPSNISTSSIKRESLPFNTTPFEFAQFTALRFSSTVGGVFEEFEEESDWLFLLLLLVTTELLLWEEGGEEPGGAAVAVVLEFEVCGYCGWKLLLWDWDLSVLDLLGLVLPECGWEERLPARGPCAGWSGLREGLERALPPCWDRGLRSAEPRTSLSQPFTISMNCRHFNMKSRFESRSRSPGYSCWVVSMASPIRPANTSLDIPEGKAFSLSLFSFDNAISFSILSSLWKKCKGIKTQT